MSKRDVLILHYVRIRLTSFYRKAHELAKELRCVKERNFKAMGDFTLEVVTDKEFTNMFGIIAL